VAGCAVRPLAGGAVALRVEQVTLHLTGPHDPLELVRKQAPAHEIAGLRADQIEGALTQLRSLGIRDGSCRDHG
jgi:hypothetical protein